ncbi:prolipoprotein diacylglyceryl transferase [Candidatus Pacearchaeota archaeon]|nr:prolipoprotein diacylglyceryl transferase [Candidatus Pacearchaeota archaeon]
MMEMKFPINFHIGSVAIPSHSVFEILAFFFAFVFYFHLQKKQRDPLHFSNRESIILGGAIGALLFSRLLASLEDPASFFHPSSFLYYIQGKTIVGGILGAIIGVEITKKIIGEKRPSGDLFTYPLILGMIIGRIGCFLTGVSDRTVGIVSSVPWAFDQGDGLPRHPTSLYEIVFLGILWLVILGIERKWRLKPGVRFKLFVIGYLTFRIAIEFIKPLNPLILGLSAIQLASLIGAGYYIMFLYNTE